MRTKRWDLALGLGLLIFAGLACNFSASTANLSGLKLGKDQAVTTETSSFAAGDTVYALATVSTRRARSRSKGSSSSTASRASGASYRPRSRKDSRPPRQHHGHLHLLPRPPRAGPRANTRSKSGLLDEKGEEKDKKTADFSVN